MINSLKIVALFFLISTAAQAAELSGVHIDEQIKLENNRTLVLNGAGLREKFWVDVYVGSLYLEKKTENVAEILSSPGSWRIQLDFVYKEVDQKKLLDAWREGFKKNQSKETLDQISSQIEQFYGYFDSSVKAKEQYILDYLPGTGVKVQKNQKVLGVISGDLFKNAVLEIWLGNSPADKDLKRGMLGM